MISSFFEGFKVNTIYDDFLKYASKNGELNIGELFCGSDTVRIDAGKPEVLEECKEIIDKFYL